MSQKIGNKIVEEKELSSETEKTGA